ncbi:hypothetical protein [Streptomyces sp. NBC_00207]|uniref:hypothetical protein n=1 Tax=unclassified Streptomyces TaxID=2593676 RepID=UPI002887C9E5|nr:hypothetical protein [Streptomyces sp. DSM 41633]
MSKPENRRWRSIDQWFASEGLTANGRPRTAPDRQVVAWEHPVPYQREEIRASVAESVTYPSVLHAIQAAGEPGITPSDLAAQGLGEEFEVLQILAEHIALGHVESAPRSIRARPRYVVTASGERWLAGLEGQGGAGTGP